MSELIWYHGKISKQEALKRFRQFHPDGSFLIRNSETILNAFVLCIGYDKNVYNYRIHQDANQRLLFEDMTFYTLSEIISHYHLHQGQLVCLLKHPVLPPLPTAQEPCALYVTTVAPLNHLGYENPMTFGSMVHNFRVFKKDGKLVIKTSDADNQKVFSSLWEIIELFKKPSQGLPCELRDPVIKESSDQLEHDSDDDEIDDDYESPDGTVSSCFLTKFSEMDISGLDNKFCEDLKSFLNSGFSRHGTRLNTPESATDLQELIVKCASGVQRELNEFLKKIMFLQELFNSEKDTDKPKCVASSTNSTRSQPNNVVAYEELVNSFTKSLAGVKSLQILPAGAHQEPIENHQSETGTIDTVDGHQVPVETQQRTFEVNTSGGFKTKAFLKVDITNGKLWFMKSESDSFSDCIVVDHDKILQLVKDPDTAKLTFKIDNKSNREYVFKDVQARENFCQLAQYMINSHAPNTKELKTILVFVGTWNMGSAAPGDIDSWLKCNGPGTMIKNQELIGVVGYDIYAIGTQESSISENAWISKLKSVLKLYFKTEYYTVAVHSLWGIRLVILAKPDHENRISRVEKSSVKTGIANKLGNKGGVGISFDFLSTSLCFINTHLASGNEELRKTRRAQNYLDILKGLNLGHKRSYDLTNQFHHVFFFGDLNYRLDMEYKDILPAIEGNDYKKMEIEDQLKKEQSLGHVLFEFHESELYFPPTYRYKRGTRVSYDHVKVKRTGNRFNVPSWCDRVLWKSFPELLVNQISYGCTNDIVTSDHSPVFASFEVPVASQFVAKQDQATINSQTGKPLSKIQFQHVKAKIQTVTKTNFYLEFHSVCIGASQKSKEGKFTGSWDPPRNVDSKPTVHRYLEWDPSMMPELNPILDDPEYLKGQHFLIAVKSEDESYGECVLSLSPHLSDLPHEFEACLTHGGVKTGEIMGYMHVKHPRPSRPLLYPKPDKGDTNQAGIPLQDRPISCYVQLPSADVMPVARKAFSLGRQNINTVQYPVHSRPGVVNHNSYMIIPEVQKRNKVNTLSNQTAERDLSTPPPLPERTLLNQTAESNSSTPPPLPERSGKDRPATVLELLWKIGLPDYLACLEEQGFEDIIFLENVTDQDLAATGINNGEHRKQILNEVHRLKTSGFFNS